MKTVPIMLFALAAMAGCASVPPRELQDARAAYQRAAAAPGAALAPVDLHEAKVSLARAETKFAADGDEPATRDLAYIAQRRAVSAEARGNAAGSLAIKQSAEADLQKFKDGQAQAMKGALASTKGALTDAQKNADSERQARRAAEDALSKIAGLQSKETDRGLVLTISGSVLFATGKSVLLPQARDRLREVAEALKGDTRTVTIVGHTDSQGADDTNLALSEARAEAVKKHLVSQGVDESHIRTVGMGEKEPVADNATAEGRANNRRVEMILEAKR